MKKNRADREPEGTEQQQPTTTNNNQQQLATTFNNQLQPLTTNNQQQQITNNILFLGAAWVSPGQFVHQSAEQQMKRHRLDDGFGETQKEAPTPEPVCKPQKVEDMFVNKLYKVLALNWVFLMKYRLVRY